MIETNGLRELGKSERGARDDDIGIIHKGVLIYKILFSCNSMLLLCKETLMFSA